MISIKKISSTLCAIFFIAFYTVANEQDVDQRITVDLGSPITITLESPQHEARMWNLQKPTDKKYLRDNKVDRSEKEEVWVFDTLKRGVTKIYMEYASRSNRLQDKNVIPYVIEVTIK